MTTKWRPRTCCLAVYVFFPVVLLKHLRVLKKKNHYHSWQVFKEPHIFSHLSNYSPVREANTVAIPILQRWVYGSVKNLESFGNVRCPFLSVPGLALKRWGSLQELTAQPPLAMLNSQCSEFRSDGSAESYAWLHSLPQHAPEEEKVLSNRSRCLGLSELSQTVSANMSLWSP